MAKKPEPPKKEGVFVRLPVDVATRLRIRAVERRISLSAAVEEAVDVWLKHKRP